MISWVAYPMLSHGPIGSESWVTVRQCPQVGPDFRTWVRIRIFLPNRSGKGLFFAKKVWDFQNGASHFCIFKTVDLAPIHKIGHPILVS